MDIIDWFRKEFDEKRYLDTVAHIIVIILLARVFIRVFTQFKVEDILKLTFIGGFIPDIDHLLLYKSSRFKNFKNFLKWIIHSHRYRIGFELFHNFPTLIFVAIILPHLYISGHLTLFIFFTSFLFHLLVDIGIDYLVLRKLKQWRF